MHSPDRIEQISTAQLIPYARNSRTHSTEQVAQIARSMAEFGFTNPVLIDYADGIIAGHGRVMAAQQLGLAQVPCIRLGYLSEAQKRAYVIADNKLAENAGWDVQALAMEIEDLRMEDYDISLTGFDLSELDELIGHQTPDFAPGTEEDQGRLDELAPKMVICPHCRKEFDARGQV